MLDSLNKKYPFNDDLNLNIKSIAWISLGVFLFLLFFQPFNPQNPDFNNKLLIFAGFSLITLLLFGFLRILIPSVFSKQLDFANWNIAKELFLNLLFLVLNSAAFVFFARYVGKTTVTFHLVIEIVIISFASMVVWILINEFQYLKNQIKSLSSKIEVAEEIDFTPNENIEIVFETANKLESFQLFIEQIILVKSANNYIEVIYLKDEKVSRRLIRNTLTNTEELFSKYPNMIRCHRSCIVNKSFIQKVTKEADGLKLDLFDYPQKIHVSRQYVLKVKEALTD